MEYPAPPFNSFPFHPITIRNDMTNLIHSASTCRYEVHHARHSPSHTMPSKSTSEWLNHYGRHAQHLYTMHASLLGAGAWRGAPASGLCRG